MENGIKLGKSAFFLKNKIKSFSSYFVDGYLWPDCYEIGGTAFSFLGNLLKFYLY